LIPEALKFDEFSGGPNEATSGFMLPVVGLEDLLAAVPKVEPINGYLSAHEWIEENGLRLPQEAFRHRLKVSREERERFAKKQASNGGDE